MSSFNYVTIHQHSIIHTKYQIIIISTHNNNISMIGVIGFNDYKIGLNSLSSLKHDVGELIRQIQDEAMCLRTYGASLVLLMGKMMIMMIMMMMIVIVIVMIMMMIVMMKVMMEVMMMMMMMMMTITMIITMMILVMMMMMMLLLFMMIVIMMMIMMMIIYKYLSTTFRR